MDSIITTPMETRTAVLAVSGETVSETPWTPVTVPTPITPIKLDIGCGPNKKAGFVGTDCIAFPGVDVVTDLKQPWPWPDNSVSEAHSSHCLEHFNGVERCHFLNELWRVLVPGGKATVITPHWGSCRAYGDPTHAWPPCGDFMWYYLRREWRATNAPHTDAQHWDKGYKCDFDVTWGHSIDGEVALRNQEFQQFALKFYKEAAQDMIATLVKRA